jgi:hypothetical protein
MPPVAKLTWGELDGPVGRADRGNPVLRTGFGRGGRASGCCRGHRSGRSLGWTRFVRDCGRRRCCRSLSRPGGSIWSHRSWTVKRRRWDNRRLSSAPPLVHPPCPAPLQAPGSACSSARVSTRGKPQGSARKTSTSTRTTLGCVCECVPGSRRAGLSDTRERIHL